jgi:hypothetical protein
VDADSSFLLEIEDPQELDGETLIHQKKILAKLNEGKPLELLEEKTLYTLIDRIEAKNAVLGSEREILSALEKKALAKLKENERFDEFYELDVNVNAIYRLIVRIKEKNKAGLDFDEFEELVKETLSRKAELILASSKKQDIKPTQVESKILELLRKFAKNNEDEEFDELERQILNLPIARIMHKRVEDEDDIKNILSESHC